MSILAELAVGILMLEAPLLGHHGTAVYDREHPVTVSGTVTEYRFTNPHILLFWEAKDASGNVQKWAAEIGAPNNTYRRFGWTSKTIKAGDTITITGAPSKNGTHTMISGPEEIMVNGQKILPPEIGEAAGRSRLE
jgi:hypothetical protein